MKKQSFFWSMIALFLAGTISIFLSMVLSGFEDIKPAVFICQIVCILSMMGLLILKLGSAQYEFDEDEVIEPLEVEQEENIDSREETKNDDETDKLDEAVQNIEDEMITEPIEMDDEIEYENRETENQEKVSLEFESEINNTSKKFKIDKIKRINNYKGERPKKIIRKKFSK